MSKQLAAILALSGFIFSTGVQSAQQPPVANANSFIDADKSGIVYNGHEYKYDILSGATVQPSRPFSGKAVKPLPLEEKDKIMYWTATPPMGLIAGEFYGLDHRFGHFNDHYNALIDLVVDNGRIVHVEMDEKLSPTYYNKDWASQKKRRTGYTFFQFEKPRTDVTKVTWANGVTFLEWQILKHQSLNIDFDTVYGSSNSARDGFIPAVAVLKDMVQKPSGQYYLGYSEVLPGGLIGRIQLVYEGDKIVRADYDEIFPDRKEDIADENLKKYYRQSKFDSVPYNRATNGEFQKFARTLSQAILAQNSLNVAVDNAPAEFTNFRKLAAIMQPAVDSYLKNGYKHNVGKIAERPEGMPVNPAKISRQADIDMKLVSSAYNKARRQVLAEVEVVNKSDKDYTFKTESFYLYVLNDQNIYDTLADPNHRELTVKAGSSVRVPLDIRPVRDSDTNLQLKYDGRNKVYHSMNIPK